MVQYRSGEVMADPAGFLERHEVEEVIEAARCERDRLLIEGYWITGARCTELLLIWPIDLGRGKITLRTLKRKKKKPDRSAPTRVVPLRQDYMTSLRAYIRRMKIPTHGWVFAGQDGRSHLTRTTAYRIVRGACERAGYDYIGEKTPHPHHLRHSMAIDFYRVTKDLRSLQLILAHDSLETTAKYLKYLGKDVAEASDERWA